MENEKNELTLFSEKQKNIYCSVDTKTEEERKKLYNALESCDVLLKDCVGQEIEIKDIYTEKRTIIDDETGEEKPKFRTILFAENGQTYATGSYGIFNAISKIVTIYGLPDTWEKSVKVKVSERPLGNGKKSLTLILL